MNEYAHLAQAAADLRSVHERMGDLFSDAEQTLIVLRPELSTTTYERLQNRLTRLRELRNSMELGSFSLLLDAAASEAGSYEPLLTPIKQKKKSKP
jgi:hypothetical protein